MTLTELIFLLYINELENATASVETVFFRGTGMWNISRVCLFKENEVLHTAPGFVIYVLLVAATNVFIDRKIVVWECQYKP